MLLLVAEVAAVEVADTAVLAAADSVAVGQEVMVAEQEVLVVSVVVDSVEAVDLLAIEVPV